MRKMGKVDMKGLKEFQKQLEKLQDPDDFLESCTKELAAHLLGLVKRRTPVGVYSDTVEFDANIPAGHVEFDTKDGKHVSFDTKARKKHVEFSPKGRSGKVGGTLRRGWTIGEIRKEGTVYKIDIINPVEYASWVEYGHCTANRKGWVKGQFMMTISEQELEKIAPKVLENKIKKFLRDISK